MVIVSAAKVQTLVTNFGAILHVQSYVACILGSMIALGFLFAEQKGVGRGRVGKHANGGACGKQTQGMEKSSRKFLCLLPKPKDQFVDKMNILDDMGCELRA